MSVDYCRTCANFVEDDPCDICEGKEENHVYYEPDFTKQTTNADYIRAMTDVELALLFGSYGCPNNNKEIEIESCDIMKHGGNIETCKRCWLDWLKQEVTDGD